MAMTTVTTIGANGELTLPAEIRAAAHLNANDTLDVEVTPEGVLLRPHVEHDPDQAWFWTEEWQAGERAASEQLAAGLGERFDSDEAFLDALDRWTKKDVRDADV